MCKTGKRIYSATSIQIWGRVKSMYSLTGKSVRSHTIGTVLTIAITKSFKYSNFKLLSYSALTRLLDSYVQTKI